MLWGEMTDQGPADVCLSKGELQVKVSGTHIDRRSRSKVRVHIVVARSVGWVQALEDWGASIEAVVKEDAPDPLKSIRHLITSSPTSIPQQALSLEPSGPWGGAMFAPASARQEFDLFSKLFNCWRPAIAVLSAAHSTSRADLVAQLPNGLPISYKKRIITIRHDAVRGVTGAFRRFVHYTRWTGIISYPSIMTSNVLPRTLQTALSDTYGAAQGVTFEARAGMNPPDVISIAVLVSDGSRSPVYSSDSMGPDLASLTFREAQIWVRAHSVFSKETVLRQVRIAELMAIWDYEGKLESVGWTRAHSLSILRARLSAPPAKMLRYFAQTVCDTILLKLQPSQLLALDVDRSKGFSVYSGCSVLATGGQSHY